MREIHDSIGKNSVVQELASQIAEDFSDSGKFKLDPTWINVQVCPIMKDQVYKVSDFQEVPG